MTANQRLADLLRASARADIRPASFRIEKRP